MTCRRALARKPGCAWLPALLLGVGCQGEAPQPEVCPPGQLQLSTGDGWQCTTAAELAGLMAAAGTTGSTGATGPNGTAGATGLPGDEGATGATGATGFAQRGATGNTGAVGPAGTSAIGVNGATGAAGGHGTNGLAGGSGATGITGATGTTGAAGVSGATGSGLMGNPGPTGSTGTAGNDGIAGVTGPTGTGGLTGATGASPQLPACAPGQLFQATASGWSCLSLPSLSLPAAPTPCPFGSASRWDGAQWNCDSLAAETYECPQGYSRDSETDYIACAKSLSGRTDEMIGVGPTGGPPVFWIDRYELSLCSGSLGNEDGYGMTAVGCSVSGVQPLTEITWFQAEQLCLNAGKTLCTNEEWQTAATGTSDPGAWPNTSACTGPIPGAGFCNTCSSGTRVTGLGGASAGGDCYSVFGAEDMVGNVWEWVADWGQAGPTFTATDANQVSPWPSGYGDGKDSTWNLNGTAFGYSAWGQGLPAAPGRGGAWNTGWNGGPFSDSLYHSPAYPDNVTGARCCAGGRR